MCDCQPPECLPAFGTDSVPAASGQTVPWRSPWGGGQPVLRGRLLRIEVANIGKARAEVGLSGPDGQLTEARASMDLAPGQSGWLVAPAGQAVLNRSISSTTGTELRLRADATSAAAQIRAPYRRTLSSNVGATLQPAVPPQGLVRGWVVSTTAATVTFVDPDGPATWLTLTLAANTPTEVGPITGETLVSFTIAAAGVVTLYGETVL